MSVRTLREPARPANTRTGGARLPELVDHKTIREEMGLSRTAAERVMRLLPKVEIPGLRKVYVRRSDVLRLIEEHTRQ